MDSVYSFVNSKTSASRPASPNQMSMELKNLLGEDLFCQMNGADIVGFLKVTNGNVPKAATLISAYFEWRKLPLHEKTIITADNILDPEKKAYIESTFYGSSFGELFPHSFLGHDKVGRPVTWAQGGIAGDNLSKVLKFMSFEDVCIHYVYLREYTNKVRMPLARRVVDRETRKSATVVNDSPSPTIDQHVIVIDLTGVPFTLDSATLSLIKFKIHMDNNYYPNRECLILLINTPVFFKGIWAMVKLFLSQRSLKMIQLLGDKEEYLPVLLEHMDTSQIPLAYGGSRNLFSWTYPENHTLDTEDVIAAAITSV